MAAHRYCCQWTPNATCKHLDLCMHFNMFCKCAFFFSQGKFQGLDLNEELYVGGYPNYTLLAKTAGIKTGFVGEILFCLHHRRVKWSPDVEVYYGIYPPQVVSVSWSSKGTKWSSKTWTAALRVSQTVPPAKTTHVRSVTPDSWMC